MPVSLAVDVQVHHGSNRSTLRSDTTAFNAKVKPEARKLISFRWLSDFTGVNGPFLWLRRSWSGAFALTAPRIDVWQTSSNQSNNLFPKHLADTNVSPRGGGRKTHARKKRKNNRRPWFSNWAVFYLKQRRRPLARVSALPCYPLHLLLSLPSALCCSIRPDLLLQLLLSPLHSFFSSPYQLFARRWTGEGCLIYSLPGQGGIKRVCVCMWVYVCVSPKDKWFKEKQTVKRSCLQSGFDI